MPQFETEVPHPLREDLPELLAPGGMRTPPICVLLLIFVSEHALKPSSVEVEIYHIGRSERSLWQGRVEQFVDHLATRGTDHSLDLGRRMGGDNDSCVRPDRRKSEIRKVKKGSTRSRFGMARLLVRRLRQASLDRL
jgi:hypothetical protein